MIKKAIFLFAIAICSVLFPAVMHAATDMSGRWSMFPCIGYDITKVIESPDKVYAVSNGNLFSRGLDDDEIYLYSTSNKLSDTGVTDIYYNPAGKYLLITYSNGNIDLLYDDGRVANLPEIKDAVISAGHGINHAAFADNRIYLATDFGIAVYDEAKLEVIDSGIYNRKATHLLPMGDNLLLIIDQTAYVSSKKEKHHSFDSFRELINLWCKDVAPLNETSVAYNHSSGLYRAIFDFEKGSVDRIGYGIKPTHDKLLTQSDGSVIAYDANRIYTAGPDGIENSCDIPEALSGTTLFVNDGTSSVWGVDIDGIGHYDLSKSSPTVLMQPFRPEALTVDQAVHFSWSNDGDRLYITRHTPTQYLINGSVDDFSGIQTVNRYEPATGKITDLTVRNFDPSDIAPSMASQQRNTGWDGLVGGPSRVIEDPDDPDVWYQAFNGQPFFVFRGNEVEASFNSTNCYNTTGSPRGYNVSIDPEGNLWLGIGHNIAAKATFLILPAAKRRGDLKAVTKSDFIHLSTGDFVGTRDLSALFCKRSNIVFVSVGEARKGFYVIDTKGTYTDFSDDDVVYNPSFRDSEGHELNAEALPYAVEDNTGQIWCPSAVGPLVIQRPAEALSPNFGFKRPIVPRNDGTPYGDYLLDGVKVTRIAVDPSNRKWLATETDGVYLVNADGTEIIAHYNNSNSPLMSNNVYAVTCDPHSNRVYFGTADGMYMFDSDSSPAAEDYSDVYAYPNPVRPEYTGWITIAGLKDNSLVKIADIAGNVFFQGRSEGGMISWDGCNSAGERVRTGVYFVFASENADGSYSGAVTKIMVVN